MDDLAKINEMMHGWTCFACGVPWGFVGPLDARKLYGSEPCAHEHWRCVPESWLGRGLSLQFDQNLTLFGLMSDFYPGPTERDLAEARAYINQRLTYHR